MQNRNCLLETECALAKTDLIWRDEVTQRFGPDSVLTLGHREQAKGEDGTPMRRAFEARGQAVAAWRNARRQIRFGAGTYAGRNQSSPKSTRLVSADIAGAGRLA
ncbi:hypothetical protein OCOJLMKI_1350 [Methylobacterium iners]|uniref:Uncharacterized protein n=1 Tax=Methylobacterium iners TaxID=418707 RepID=A0ABQ4RTM8_9HYPH|nr:hypothetical protein OCOJLMKI_1350 [Methylobacterium iners]